MRAHGPTPLTAASSTSESFLVSPKTPHLILKFHLSLSTTPPQALALYWPVKSGSKVYVASFGVQEDLHLVGGATRSRELVSSIQI